MLIWTAMLNRPSFGNLRERWKLWVGQPAPWIWFLDITALLLVAPLILWLDPFDGYRPGSEGLDDLGSRLAALARPFATNRLQLDDFEYVAESRTPAALSRSAFTPHNTHLVPLFRVWTYLWVRAAGSLAELPEAFGVAGYLTYVVTMLLLGHVIAWESGRTAHGFAFMALFGVSALLEPTVRWFAASQALLAGTVVLASLAAWQRWRAGGSWVWLLLGTLATMAAPLVWSGGYVAGPAGLVYLLASGQSRDRRVAWVPLAGSLAVAVAAALVAGSTIAAPANFHDRTLREAINPIQGAISTAQGCVEILALHNLGLEALATTAGQGSCSACSVWPRGLRGAAAPARANPLEAAGATVLHSRFRPDQRGGGATSRSIASATLSWYQAIPQLGAVLFLAGMLLGDDPSERLSAAPTADTSDPGSDAGRRRRRVRGIHSAAAPRPGSPGRDRGAADRHRARAVPDSSASTHPGTVHRRRARQLAAALPARKRPSIVSKRRPAPRISARTTWRRASDASWFPGCRSR
ncbi:MAG: hypothetical protein U0794_10880 [Isosphaeraceae bacterium]